MRVAATADLHCQLNSAGSIGPLFERVDQEADVLVIAGDLTHWGLPDEVHVLERELSDLRLPIIAVLGNHDHTGDQPETIDRMLRELGVVMLDRSAYELDGISFVGTKGFCGGFGEELVRPFGERALKTFIDEGVNEALQLGDTLKATKTRRRMVVLHYAPIKTTLLGEPPEIHAFLGSGYLGSVVDDAGADLIVHGHAHFGIPQGRTSGGIPVYNVCRYVQSYFKGRAYQLFDL